MTYIFEISVAKKWHIMNAIMHMEQPKNQNFYQNLFEQISELHVFFKQSKKVQETISP
jgi:hypothetical protein